MKLLFQSDDYGFTGAVTQGILKGIEEGVVRNTGLFVNMDSSEKAARIIKNYPQVCVGQDINLVAGKPISEANLIPSLVDDEGNFISSVARMSNNKLVERKGHLYIFEKDPYVYEEVLIEVENQVKKFVELMGKLPQYLHGHSLSTPNIKKAMNEVAQKYGLRLTEKMAEDAGLKRVPVDWNPKPFTFSAQIETDVEQLLLNALSKMLNEDKVIFVCHCGYLDAELFDLSTYTAIRTKDLKAATSKKLKDFIKDNNIELITYNEL